MSDSAALPMNGSAHVNRGLRRYAEAVGSRRSVQRLLGPDVDPDYCFTDFLFCVGTKDAARLRQVYGAERTKTAMGENPGIIGGYLVPEELRADIMADISADSLIRPRATVVQMGSATTLLPIWDASTAQSAGTAPFWGGLKLSWTAEGNTRPETEPAFRQLTLKAWDLTGYALASNTFYADAVGIESWLRQMFTRSVAWYAEYAYFNGANTGVGQPVGLITAPGAKLITRQAGNAFSQTDVGNMSKALLPVSWERAIWAVSPTVWAQMLSLGGAGGAPAWQINQPIAEGKNQPHFVLNGQAGFVSSKLPALGTQGDVLLFDPLLYVIGDRGALEIAASLHEPTAFKNNQQVWRVTYRGDGQPWVSKAVTLPDASNTVSPYVVLV